MSENDIDNLLSNLNFSIEDPDAFEKIFSYFANKRQNELSRDVDNLQRTCLEEYDELSRRIDRSEVQESTTVRNILRSRRIANLLINEKGELNSNLIPRFISLLTSNLYSLGPNRYHDAVRQRQIINVLTKLQKDPGLVQLLKKIHKPYSHPIADQIIRDTLQLPANMVVNDFHARRAALAAWLCYLRQNVGSCFATAPAIMIHDEQPELFLIDISEMLGTGRLKRTFGGIEYSVPMSVSWGIGDLKKPFVFRPNSEIWMSPGIMVALESINVIDKTIPLADKLQHIKNLIFNLFPKEFNPQLLTVETLLRMILLNHLGITAHDLKEYDERPPSILPTTIVTTRSEKTLGKTELCALYYQYFSTATYAFKALTECALLKAWEFTLASFSETKSQFTRWNLYSSLGLEMNQKGGIGACLYEILQRKIDECQDKIREYQVEYEQLYVQVKYLESKLKNSTSEKEAQWNRVEYQTKANEFYLLEEMRDKYNAKAHRYANLFNDLIEFYDKLFPQYFQEIYDPEMLEINPGPYDDSPAGFRLLYKHGRSSTAQWTRIKNPSEFIDALASFFAATEREIYNAPEFEGIQQDLSDITTSVIMHVKSHEFLETAFYRMAAAHNTPIMEHPLEHLDKVEKKPWAYTSGGTMHTLVSCYYRQEQKPTEIARWVENPMELLVYLVDILKQEPPKIMQSFIANSNKSMLMHSPTHAFLLKPGFPLFKEAWENDAFTFTWIRDNFVRPMERKIDQLELNFEMMDFLIELLSKEVPDHIQPFFRDAFNEMRIQMNSVGFREYVLKKIDYDRRLHIGGYSILPPERVDSLLFSKLPLTPKLQLKDKLLNLFNEIPKNLIVSYESKFKYLVNDALNPIKLENLIDADRLQNIFKTLLCLAAGKITFDVDFDLQISLAAQRLGYACPTPILFADTNWVKDYFGFVVSPATARLELWRFDRIARSGSPMSSWEMWLNGSRKDNPWGVYSQPLEYSL